MKWSRLVMLSILVSAAIPPQPARAQETVPTDPAQAQELPNVGPADVLIRLQAQGDQAPDGSARQGTPTQEALAPLPDEPVAGAPPVARRNRARFQLGSSTISALFAPCRRQHARPGRARARRRGYGPAAPRNRCPAD